MERTEISDDLRNLLDKDFVLPAKNQTEFENKLVTSFVYDTNMAPKDYYRNVVSLVLARLGDKGGVSFDTYTRKLKSDPVGQFIERPNKILMAEDFVNTRPLAHTTLVLSHETFHKHQSEVNKQAKVLGRLQDRYTVGNPEFLPQLLGFGDVSMFYHINNSEKQAYAFDKVFTTSFLNKAYGLAHFMKDPYEEVSVIEQQNLIEKITKLEQQAIKTAENKFIAKSLPAFYNSTNKTFNSLVSYFINSQVNTQEELRRDYPNLVQRISPLSANGQIGPEVTAYAMTAVLGVCPKRENVETFIDAITTSRIDVSPFALQGIIDNRAPITQSDLTRLALSSIGTGNELPKIFSPKLLDAVDETAWAKNLVLTVGADRASSFIEQFKTSGEMPNTNFDQVERYISTYSNKPLLTVGDTTFYNCRDILQYVTARESEKYSRFSDNAMYFENCGLFSKTLANVIGHFDKPSADNEEFITALSSFVADPRQIQFEEKEVYNEVGVVFTPDVSEKIADYISEVRSQGTENNPSLTAFNPLNEDGKTYGEALNDSANDLSRTIADLVKSIQTITDTINEIGIPTLLERLGVSDLAAVETEQDSITVRVSTSGQKLNDGDAEQNDQQGGEAGELVATVDTTEQTDSILIPSLVAAELSAMIGKTYFEPVKEFIIEDTHTSNYMGILTGLQMEHEQNGTLNTLGTVDSTEKLNDFADMHSHEYYGEEELPAEDSLVQVELKQDYAQGSQAEIMNIIGKLPSEDIIQEL